MNSSRKIVKNHRRMQSQLIKSKTSNYKWNQKLKN